jgi:hypothetical protein
MKEIARWIYALNKTQPVEELIHAPLAGWENLKKGAPLNYGAGTDADHDDHVHWAMANMVNNVGQLISMATGDGAAGPAGSPGIGAMVQQMMNGPLAAAAQAAGSGGFGGLVGAIPPNVFYHARQALVGKVNELAAKMGVGSSVGAGPVPQGSGEVVDQVKRAMAPYGWDQGPQWEALNQLIAHESSWDPTAGYSGPVNSDAYGLFQFLGDTWGTVGGTKTDNPFQQAVYGARYIKQRYQDPIGAWDHWQNPPDWPQNGHWYDEGGVIPPGVTQVHNELSKPEALLNPGQWDTAQNAIDFNNKLAESGAFDGAKEIANMTVTAQSVSVSGAISNAVAPAISGATTDIYNTGTSSLSGATPDLSSYDPLAGTGVSTDAQLTSLQADLEVGKQELAMAQTDEQRAIAQDAIDATQAQIDNLNSAAATTSSTNALAGSIDTSSLGTALGTGDSPELASARKELQAAHAELANAKDEASYQAANQKIDDLTRKVAELEVKQAQDRNKAANAAIAAGAANSGVPGTISPQAQAAIDNTTGAAPVVTPDYNNNGTDPNDPALNNPYTDPSINGGTGTGKTQPTWADQRKAWEDKYTTEAQQWGENAAWEIADQFLEPLGLSGPAHFGYNEWKKAIAEGVAEGMNSSTAGNSIAGVNNSLGIPNMPGLPATPGAPGMAAPQISIGQVTAADPQKAMDELSRLIGFGMQAISRFR